MQRPYRVEMLARAERALRQLQLADSKRVTVAMVGLSRDPFPPGATKVVGTGYWRIRVGDLRLIYAVDETSKLVIVLRVLRRNEATYRRIRENVSE